MLEKLDSFSFLSCDIKKLLSKLTKNELQKLVLYNSSWHHTSNYFNKTEFYCLDEGKLEELTIDDINIIINSRVTKEPNKAKDKPKYITALITYDEWVGRFKNYKNKKTKHEIVNFLSSDKMVNVSESANYQKRLSSITVVCKIEQKTKFADKSRLIARYKKQHPILTEL